MTARRPAGSQPPQRPSAVSASPSSCKAPVTAIIAATAATVATPAPQTGSSAARAATPTPASDRQREHATLCGHPAVGVEDEVPEPVVHVGGAEVAGTQQDVGVRAHDDVGAGLDQTGGELPLALDRAGRELPAPVQVDDDRVGLAPGRAH